MLCMHVTTRATSSAPLWIADLAVILRAFSCDVQDVIRRYKDAHPGNWDLLPERVAFQLNDTHPTIAVPELMRILMDENKLGWTASWAICTKVSCPHHA